MSTRSLSSPKSVVRSQTAPSSSKTWPCLRNSSSACYTTPDCCRNRSENHRAIRVGGHELEVDPLVGELLAGAIAVARQHDGSRELALRGLGEPDVQEARAGDRYGLDAGLDAQMQGDRLGDLARWPRCE